MSLKRKLNISNDASEEDEEADVRPLPKLVLKVNKEQKSKLKMSPNNTETKNDTSHRKKKKKLHHKSDEMNRKVKKREGNDTVESEIQLKKVHISKRNKKAASLPKVPEFSRFQLCIENLHRNLQRKDVYNIFSLPVTDLIAPGYSKIIKTPMDFLTMQCKIENKQYCTIEQFRDDFVLMCNNAMLYNGSDTIYYKNAEKMLAVGLKILSKVKVKKLNRSLGVAVSDSEYVHVQIEDDVDNSTDEIVFRKKGSKMKHESSDTEMNHYNKSVLTAVLKAARIAREKLLKKHPSQQYGFITKSNDGKQVFKSLNSNAQNNDDGGTKVDLEEHPLKVKTVYNNKLVEEDKKICVQTINHLSYGPFGSFGPSHDISLSTISKDESDLLVQTYGTKSGAAYAESMLAFSANSILARDYVDSVLNSITEGAYLKKSRQQKSASLVIDCDVSSQQDINDKVPKDASTIGETMEVDVDVKCLSSLADLGIDVSFLQGVNNSA